MALLTVFMTGPGVTANRRLRILLADDHPGFLEGVRKLLAPDFEIAGTVNDGIALVAAAAALRPDAVISDMNMPGLNGIDAGHFVIKHGHCQAFILLSMYNDRDLIRRAFEVGIRGYVLKVDAGEELAAAVGVVVNGECYMSREVLAVWKEGYAEDQSSSGG